MKFRCKQISISDEELGCTLIFSDTNDKEFYKTHSYDEINENEEYILLQKSYPEDELESDYYTIECSNPDLFNELENCKIEVSKKKLIINEGAIFAEIELNTIDEEYKEMIHALKSILNGKTELIIKE